MTDISEHASPASNGRQQADHIAVLAWFDATSITYFTHSEKKRSFSQKWAVGEVGPFGISPKNQKWATWKRPRSEPRVSCPIGQAQDENDRTH